MSGAWIGFGLRLESLAPASDLFRDFPAEAWLPLDPLLARSRRESVIRCRPKQYRTVSNPGIAYRSNLWANWKPFSDLNGFHLPC